MRVFVSLVQFDYFFKKAHAGKNYLVNFFSIKSAAQYLKLPKRANVQILYIGLPNIKKTLSRTTFSGW